MHFTSAKGPTGVYRKCDAYSGVAIVKCAGERIKEGQGSADEGNVCDE